MCKMRCKKYVSGIEKRKKRLKQVSGSCRKFTLEIKLYTLGGGAITQFLPLALPFLLTPLYELHVKPEFYRINISQN
jgi:hypothetical protein